MGFTPTRNSLQAQHNVAKIGVIVQRCRDQPRGTSVNKPSNIQRKDTQAILVSVLMHDGSRYRGYIHLPENHRLQDLLNDARGFIPLEQASSSEAITIVAKHFIVSIEELREGLNEFGLKDIALS
jgi:hypothetical protein